MFYDQAANSRRPLSGLRIVAGAASVVLLPPFIMLAVTPMLILLLPVALVAIPIMIPAFFGSAHSTQVEVQRLRSWRPGAAVPAHA